MARLGGISERRILKYKPACIREHPRASAFNRVLLQQSATDPITPLDFGAWVQRRRRALGLEIRDIEEMVPGLSRSKIQRIEVGADEATADLIRLLWVLGVDVGWLCPISGTGTEGGS